MTLQQFVLRAAMEQHKNCWLYNDLMVWMFGINWPLILKLMVICPILLLVQPLLSPIPAIRMCFKVKIESNRMETVQFPSMVNPFLLLSIKWYAHRMFSFYDFNFISTFKFKWFFSLMLTLMTDWIWNVQRAIRWTIECGRHTTVLQ